MPRHTRVCRAALVLITLLLAVPAAQAESPPEGVRLTLEHYRELLATAADNGEGSASWTGGNVVVTLPADRTRPVQVLVTANVSIVGKDAAEVPFLPASTPLLEVEAGDSDLPLLRRNGVHTAVISAGKPISVRIRYLVVPETGDDGVPFALVPLPPLSGAKLAVEGPGAGDAEVWPGLDVQRAPTEMEATLPSAAAVVIRYGQGRSAQQVRRVSYQLNPGAEGEGADVKARLEVEVTGNRAQVRIAKTSSALMDVREGNRPLATAVENGWHTATLNGRGRHVVEATFRLPVDRSQGQPMVHLDPDHVPITEVTIEVPGKRSVTFEPAVPTQTRFRGKGTNATTRTRAFLPPSERVAIRWTEARAAAETKVRVNTEIYQLLSLEEGVLRARALARYDVIYGKLKEIALELPEGVVPYKLLGDGIEDWRVIPATEDSARHVRVVLGRELEGKLAFELQLEVPVSPKAGTPITLPLVHPLVDDRVVTRQQGVVALFDGDKVGFAQVDPAGYRKVGQDALPSDIRQELRDTVNQAFKHLEPPLAIESAVALAQAKDVRFDAKVDTLYLVREGALTAQASALIEIKSGRRDTLHISVPEGVSEPRISGPSINKVKADPEFPVDPGRAAYAVTFTQPLEGAILLDIEFERILAKDLGALPLADIRVHGAEVESGSFGLATETGIEVQPREDAAAQELRTVDVNALPKSIRLRSDLEIRLAYEYAHAPWSLPLSIKRHRTVETLDAQVAKLRLETHVLESGHLATVAAYEVINEDRQFMRLGLPEDAVVIEVTAGGRKVDAREDAEAGAIAIPLPKSQTTVIAVTYETRRAELGLVNNVALQAPRIDLRTRDIQWKIELPGALGVAMTTTDLKDDPALAWSPMPDVGNALPREADPTVTYFTYPVHNVTDPPLTVGFVLTATAGPGLESVVFLMGLLALTLVVVRRARGGVMDRRAWIWMLVGVGALALKATTWTLDGEEAAVAIIVLLSAHFIARNLDSREAVDALA